MLRGLARKAEAFVTALSFGGKLVESLIFAIKFKEV